MDPAALVPHRPPLLCLDRFSRADAAGAEAETTVRAGPHAPGGALWEGALVEGLAQSAAGIHASAGGSELPLLTGLRDLEVLRTPRVGERVTYQVSVARRLGPLVIIAGAARVGDEVVARGELTFFAPLEDDGGAEGNDGDDDRRGRAPPQTEEAS